MDSTQKFSAGELSIDRSPKGLSKSIELHWRGKSNTTHPGDELNPFLTSILLEAATLNLPIEMHFEAIAFVNSTTVSYLVQFLRKARDRGVHLIFVYDAASRWQRLSFEALRVFEDENGLFRLRVI